MLSMWLDDVHTFAEPECLNTFQKNLRLEWIETVLKTTNKASIRRRKLPAELMINWQRAHIDSHWLTPIKSNTRFDIIEEYSDGDCLVEDECFSTC